jgi:hypothetical protein
MLKIDDFVFTKNPDVFKEDGMKGRIYMAGSLPTREEYGQLQKTVRSKAFLRLFDSHCERQVLIASSEFHEHAVWGFRYELVLYEHTPINLSRTRLSDMVVERIGESMLSPRFRIVAQFDDTKEQLPIRKVVDYDFDIQIRVAEETETFKIRFEDRCPVRLDRKDFSRWTSASKVTVEILMGYLEQSELISVARGEASQVKYGIRASGNWIILMGSGKARARPQEYEYSISESSSFESTFERTGQGALLVEIKTPLIPELKPRDLVSIYWPEMEMSQYTKTIDSVDHIMGLKEVYTRITYVEKTKQSV